MCFKGGMIQHKDPQIFLLSAKSLETCGKLIRKELNEFVYYIDTVIMDGNYTLTISYFHLSFGQLGFEKRNKRKIVADYQTVSFRKGFNFLERDLRSLQ